MFAMFMEFIILRAKPEAEPNKNIEYILFLNGSCDARAVSFFKKP